MKENDWEGSQDKKMKKKTFREDPREVSGTGH